MQVLVVALAPACGGAGSSKEAPRFLLPSLLPHAGRGVDSIHLVWCSEWVTAFYSIMPDLFGMYLTQGSAAMSHEI